MEGFHNLGDEEQCDLLPPGSIFKDQCDAGQESCRRDNLDSVDISHSILEEAQEVDE